MLFDRTFHPDEANQAFTVGKLLETGTYTYKPTDHHGPTLYYAAAPLQKAFGHTTTAELDGTLLRCTPLVFAISGLVFLFWTVRKILLSIGKSPIFASMASIVPVAMLATSPMFVFFATDFIQEMLLACFTLMMFWSATGYYISFWEKSKLKPGSWALLFGIAAGLAFATKETSVITFLAMCIAAAPCMCKKMMGTVPFKISHLVLMVLAFFLTSITLYSSFCQDWNGVYNAFIVAPTRYLGRAAGDAAASEGANWHVHPWWQHLKWMFLQENGFSNILLLIHWVFLTLPVSIFIYVKKRTERLGKIFWGLSLYTFVITTIYTLIPYKTPWCTLQLVMPLILTTSIGYIICNKKILLALLPIWLICQCHVPGLIKLNCNPNAGTVPYNYAHASPESEQMAKCVADAMAKSTDSKPFIAAAIPTEDTWPFPWYNRKLEHLTGYWNTFDELIKLQKSGAKPTVVIVPMTQGHMVQPLFPHLKHTKRFYMRPKVRMRIFW